MSPRYNENNTRHDEEERDEPRRSSSRGRGPPRGGSNRGRGSYRSNRNRQRDQRRQDEFRRTDPRQDAAVKEIEDKINKELYFGFGDETKAKVNQVVVVQPAPSIIPVSTRFAGVYTHWIFKRIYEMHGRQEGRIPICTPYQFYRVLLAQIEYRAICVRSEQINISEAFAPELFYRPRMDQEFRDVVKSMALTFSPLTNAISAMGNVIHEKHTYYPQLPRDVVLGIVLSNLRDVVTRMANQATPREEREMFYEMNPLPFAQWNQQVRAGVRRRLDQDVINPEWPLLLNADEIMPADYAIDQFEADVHAVRLFISFVARKEQKLLSAGAGIDYSGAGHQRMLVSSDARYLRCPDRVYEDNWALEDLPAGELNTFWAPDILTSQDMFVGAMNLLGEFHAGVNFGFALRSPSAMKVRIQHRWTTIVEINK